MSEQENAGGVGEAVQAEFGIQKIYVKDISFEAPNSPAVFTVDWSPETDIKLNTSVSDLGEQHYEVILTTTVTLKIGEQTGFLVEVAQAGLFRISGLSQEQLGPVLGIHCPNVLYPFAREVVSDLVCKGGFPQFLMAPVDFQSLYMQQAARAGQTADQHSDAAAEA